VRQPASNVTKTCSRVDVGAFRRSGLARQTVELRVEAASEKMGGRTSGGCRRILAGKFGEQQRRDR
jgi:hypothetical protein